jgi:hypothetical protein
MGHYRVLARGDTKHPGISIGDNGFNQDFGGITLAIQNAGGFFVDPPRTLVHPTLGTLTYEDDLGQSVNPDITKNFILSPALKVDTAVQRTIGSSIVVQQPQVDADVVITETWVGGGNKASVLAEMFRAFHAFWINVPDVGETLTWQPADLSVESFGVLMVNVQLGGVDLEYREIPETFGQRDGAYLAETLTVQFKIAPETVAPLGTVTLVGL